MAEVTSNDSIVNRRYEQMSTSYQSNTDTHLHSLAEVAAAHSRRQQQHHQKSCEPYIVKLKAKNGQYLMYTSIYVSRIAVHSPVVRTSRT